MLPPGSYYTFVRLTKVVIRFARFLSLHVLCALLVVQENVVSEARNRVLFYVVIVVAVVVVVVKSLCLMSYKTTFSKRYVAVTSKI